MIPVYTNLCNVVHHMTADCLEHIATELMYNLHLVGGKKNKWSKHRNIRGYAFVLPIAFLSKFLCCEF